MGVSVVQIGDKIELDLSNDTVTPEKLASGVTAHDKSGNKITGTLGCKIYEVTHVKGNANIWNLLVTLDAEVLAHINDPTFAVMFVLDQAYEYENYAGSMYTASNRQIGTQNAALNPLYGYSSRQQNPTTVSVGFIYHPANQTDSKCIGGYGAFRVSNGKYYLKPSDGYIHSGTYRLIFTW